MGAYMDQPCAFLKADNTVLDFVLFIRREVFCWLNDKQQNFFCVVVVFVCVFVIRAVSFFIIFTNFCFI